MKTTHLLFIVFILSLVGCKSIYKYKSKAIQAASVYMNGLDDEVFNFEHLNIKSKFDYHSQNSDFKGIVDIRISKDSIIWLSIRSNFGFEGFRILINSDTIWVVDRVNKYVYKYDFEALSKKMNFDLNFNILQSILLGNSPHRDKKVVNIVKTSTERILSQVFSNIKVDNHISNDKNRLTNLIVTDYSLEYKTRKLSILYYKSIIINDQNLPVKYSINLEQSDNTGNLTLDVEYNKVINEQSLRYPFKIPNRYPVISY